MSNKEDICVYAQQVAREMYSRILDDCGGDPILFEKNAAVAARQFAKETFRLLSYGIAGRALDPFRNLNNEQKLLSQ